MAGEAGTTSTTTQTTATAPAQTPATPEPKEASKLIAGLSDEAISEHLEKDARGEFTRPKPKAEPKGDKPEAGKGQPTETPTEAGDPEVAKRDARINEQIKMIGKQSTEIGTLRDQVAKLTAAIEKMQTAPSGEAAPKAEAPDFFADPEGSVKKIMTQAEKEKADREAAAHKQRRDTAARVVETYPEIESLMPEMIRIAQADGIPEEALDQFARDPFGESPHAIMALAHRAKLEIEMRNLRNPSAAQKPPAQPAAIPSPGITGSRGRSGSPVGSSVISRQQIASMSDAELAELEAKGR